MAVQDIIRQAAQQYGVAPEALLAIAQLESSMNPSAQNPRSSAGGLFQFIDSTARGYGLQDRFDPAQASDAAARLARDNANYLRAQLGREPTPGELYLAHQQGAGGAAKILRDPNARAVDVLGADQVRLNVPSGTDWQNMTTQDFANLWINKANNLAGSPVAQRTNAALNRPTGAAALPQQAASGLSGMLQSFFAPQQAGQPSGLSGMFAPSQGVPQYYSDPIAYGTAVQTSDGDSGWLSSSPGRQHFDQSVHGMDMSIMRANQDAIRRATGSGTITQDTINQALANGATLVRRI